MMRWQGIPSLILSACKERGASEGDIRPTCGIARSGCRPNLKSAQEFPAPASRCSEYFALFVLALGLIGGCGGASGKPANRGAAVSGDLIVFHAGSLTVPFRKIREAFKKECPQVKVVLEAAGSRACARKISDLRRRCDVMASADYTVIDTLLIPGHADWNIKFATNEMTIAFHDKSRRRREITGENWNEILLDGNVAFGRSDPNADPCGYRAVFTMRLAEKHYGRKGLADRLLNKDMRYIRPKEVDLLALLETGEIDYAFIYRSVAEQHGLKRILLPNEVNLKDPALAGLYRSFSVEVTGRKPGTTIVKKGSPMVYGVTIPKDAPNPEAALAFVRFVLEKEKGIAIIERNGQGCVVPAPSATFDKVPAALKGFALPNK